ncbi:YczE/YyaS/YitT family protein [Guptibacillus hwajinpoensis]|uniref:Membrane protein YczE n=1 Tax=Guptibacillus hwajinpoensis TaxID=208199 RepID=A0ABU0K419_9BACL|nr:membrane protein [Alkalihalobacillus hemicentroti]MDQ0484108.1 putative membrane protein YczE [Alkalihalobacillus hemicentroti]
MKRFLFYVIGLFILTAGVTFTIKSDIGAGAWDALNVGLSDTFGLTVGSWVIIVGIILIIINAFLMKAWPDFLALITIVVTGAFIDFWLITVFKNWQIQDVFMAYAVFVAGVILIALGIAIYLQAKFAVIPIDGLMLAIHSKTGLSIRTSKTVGELLALLAALLFSGPIGVGTIIITFGIGPLVQFFYPTFEKMNA